MKQLIIVNPVKNFFTEKITDILTAKIDYVNIELPIKKESLNRYKESYNRRSRTINTSNKLTNILNLFININNTSINYDVLNIKTSNKTLSIDFTAIKAYYEYDNYSNIYAQIPLFFEDVNVIKIPKKVEVAVKHIPNKLLQEIHSDTSVARELCLLFIMHLNSTYFTIIDGTNPDGWKALSAKYLRDFFTLNSGLYLKIIDALEYKIKTGSILECDGIYIVGEKSYKYRLGEAYIGKGFTSYEVKTEKAIALLNNFYINKIRDANHNIICKNLIKFYSKVTLPTEQEILREADRLIKSKYITKKGKKLTKLNNQSKNYFKNPENRSFVEDAVLIFKYLTDNGLMIPRIGGEASGGRAVDSFTLMPSWIRNLVKVNGKPFKECDFNCLHPNISMTLYGGNKRFLNHADLVEELKIPLEIIKIEHLSFFNKEIWQMKKSPLYEYYNNYEPIMLKRIIKEKCNNKNKHKITSRRLFATEVNIMTDVIKQLNLNNIYVGYVYDALFFDQKHGEYIKEIMDEVVQKHGIYTVAKLSA
ncbi:hypothetical protein [Flavobacterium sp. ASV13]|uniref:hypothetical protein n=1 Tax=Flavobacterium sp. ASV13 TaxID=1506583 RepID=UPI0005574BF9|nr:hypothetical protein [Flavobacterium sp. ASV13]